ncbi:hypothetical protein [Verrucosispora sp. FIM060022]|uniref:hypothetical protein n=1 Tax=Verrucosispora sp. FIM060022 TaxID=1479020 RepID=UPI000F861089|nr:hypothetical protein [Verrucosispora sp. FIM060022]RUL92018.1 hypothetical protein EG812_18985 [Verrucosispora sp. FIM060022]
MKGFLPRSWLPARFRRQPPGGGAPGKSDEKPSSIRHNTIVASFSSIVNGVLNMVMLAVSARQGKTEEIAAYTVVFATLAWVAIATAGGSSLLYTTGDESERHAVRSQRLLIAVPSLVAAAALVTIAYTDRGYSPVALAAAGVAAIGNSLFELQYADLVRQMRFVLGAAVICGGKFLALALILAGTPLTAALAVISIAQFVALERMLCRGNLRRRAMWHRLSLRCAARAFLMNRQLFVVGLADVFTWRGATTALSLTASPQVVGQFGAIVSGIQALAAVFHDGLRVPMAIRARRRHNLVPKNATIRDGEAIVVTGSILAAAAVVAMAPWITTGLLGLPSPEAATWLRLLAITLPCLTVIHALKLNRIGDGDYLGATRLSLLVAALVAACLAVQLPDLDGMGAARAHVLAAVLAFGVVCAVAAYGVVRQIKSRPTRRHAAETSGSSAPSIRATVSGSNEDYRDTESREFSTKPR